MTRDDIVELPKACRVLPDLESFLHMPGWSKSDGLQISPGPIETISEKAAIGDIRIVLNKLSATVLDRGVYDGEGIVVNVLLGGEQSAKYLGPIDLNDSLLVWRPGKEDRHEYILPKSGIDLNITFPESLAEAMGWNVDNRFVRVRSPDRIKILANTCLWVLRSDTSAHDPVLGAQGSRVIAALDDVFSGPEDNDQPVLSLAQARSYELFDEAAHLLEDVALHQQATVSADAIARRLGVSRRSLFASFKRWPGIGPHKYLVLVRLHQLRKRLRQADKEETTITAEALRLGINHLGRLSSEYRELFGELPSETLHRTPGQ